VTASGRAPESVWDYPRPPAVEPSPLRATIEVGGVVIVDTDRTIRVLETSHPPVHYFPPDAIRPGLIEANARRTHCEFKGRASYWDLVLPERRLTAVAWSYPDPNPSYAPISDYVAFYPTRMDRCTLDGEDVVAQESDFYGGWITSQLTGPFKGAPGTRGW